MNTESLMQALALLLVLEGLFPFLSPSVWREAFRRAIVLSDQQIRAMGLIAMAAGLALLLSQTT